MILASKLRSRITKQLSVSPESFFSLISDPARLPEWNEKIHHVVSVPEGMPREGDEWVIEMRAMASRWRSRSRLVKVDPRRFVLSLRSQTDDGNPSYALWTWDISRSDRGARVTVSWELHPATFWRRLLFSKVRHHQLSREVATSLLAAERLVSSTPRGDDVDPRMDMSNVPV